MAKLYITQVTSYNIKSKLSLTKSLIDIYQSIIGGKVQIGVGNILTLLIQVYIRWYF